MSWMDFDNPRRVGRGKKSDLFGPKGNAKWLDGDAMAADAKKAAKNHQKAMAEQKKKEAAALKKEQDRQIKLKQQRDAKEAKKLAKLDAKRNRPV